MMNGEWEQYLEAIRGGAFDVLQFPFTPTDVELFLIRAMREVRDQQSDMMEAS
jgi:DNA-binding NtrC family response regulator